MNRIEQKFANLRKAGKKAFIAFLTAGDPHLQMTEKLVLTIFKWIIGGVGITLVGLYSSWWVALGLFLWQWSMNIDNHGVR